MGRCVNVEYSLTICVRHKPKILYNLVQTTELNKSIELKILHKLLCTKFAAENFI